MIATEINIKEPNEAEYEQVLQLVEEFWLDNINMKPEQFTIISDNGKVIAFARMKEYHDALELGTLGVAKDARGKGYGSKLVSHLLNESKQDVYVVTTMLKFNANLGFVIAEEYPESIKKKVDVCAKDFHVEEPYFVMKWEKKDN